MSKNTFYTYYGDKLYMSKDHISEKDQKEIQAFIPTWEKTATIKIAETQSIPGAVTVNPGWRLAAFGKVARELHKLFASGRKNFEITEIAKKDRRFISKSGFEVPYYEIIIRKFKLTGD